VFEKVLFPADLSESSMNLMEGVRNLKQFGMRELVILHVVEYDPERLVEGGVDVETFVSRLGERARATLEALAVELRKEVDFKYVIRTAVNPTEEILKVAEEEKVSLIVIGSKVRSLARLGSTAESVTKLAKVPVLVLRVKPEYGAGYYETLVKRLFSKLLVACQPECHASIAKHADEVVLLHAVELETLLEGKVEREKIIHPVVPINRITEILADYWMEASNKLKKVQQQLEIEGKKVKTIIRLGSPEKVVGEVAVTEGATLAVVNAKDYPNVEAVVRNCEIPTLILRS